MSGVYRRDTRLRVQRRRWIGTLPPSGATTLSPAGLVHTRALGSPVVNPSLGPASLTRTRALGATAVIPLIKPSGLVHTRTLGAITVNTNLKPAGLAHSRAIGTGPTVSPSIVLTGLNHSRTLGGPTAVTAVTITVTSLVHDRALGVPGGGEGLGFQKALKRRPLRPFRLVISGRWQEWPESDPSGMRPIFRRTRR